MLDQRIGQNGAGKRIVFIPLVRLAQQLHRFAGLPLREQFLALGDKTVSFSLALHAILSQLFQFRQLRIVGEFSGCASQ